jgi:signal recognition particle subunit SRP9
VKFKPKEGHLVLKVTDDTKVRSPLFPPSFRSSVKLELILRFAQCLKYKTYSSIILNRFEALNLRLLTSMASPRARKAVPVAETKEVEMVAKEESAGKTEEGTGKGASKKKKKGKK